ncbi:hypothetical protein DFP72DRAFT_1081870 [Ephemerocybe angulata]|uniref:F-box domain-containing protein n=1 Tax=Ephemerocybe angulata TaxID=980116 RepID=A0A8H6LVB0_9AGAR|nr:hypothetical protein DFP72DRAFT_1081870 [Tulosesus angulatus]
MAFPPTLSPLLTSNEPPSHLDTTHLIEVTASLSAAIEDALEKVKRLQAERDKCRIVLSPTRRIPQEILSEILSLLPLIPGNEEAPADLVVISLVCRAWREAAITTHSLWQGLIFNPCACRKPYNDRSPFHQAEYKQAQIWLSRSGALPKSICLERNPDGARCGCDDPRKRCESTHPTVVKMLTEGPPIDEFTLHVSSTRCFRKWTAAIASHADGFAGRGTRWAQLRSFVLVFHEEDDQLWDDSTDPKQSIFVDLPPVIEFHLNLPSPERAFEEDEDSKTRSLHIPMSFLNRLKVFVIRWEWGGSKLSELLEHCINLESFTLDLYESEVFDETNDPVTDALRISPITLVNLKEIHIRRGNIHILEVLNTPHLDTLDVEFSVPMTQTWSAIKRVGKFITASKIESTLRTLRMCELLSAHNTVYLPLPVLPALRHLVLDSREVTGYHFGIEGHLDDRSKKHPQFPQLAHFEVLNLQRSSITLQHEVSFLQRRRTGVPCMVTASYRDEVVCPEATLQTRLLSGKDVFLRVVQNDEYEDSRAWYVQKD